MKMEEFSSKQFLCKNPFFIQNNFLLRVWSCGFDVEMGGWSANSDEAGQGMYEW